MSDGLSSNRTPRTFRQAESYVSDLLTLNKYQPNDGYNPAGSFLNPRTTIKYIRNIYEELSSQGKLPRWILSNTALHILNPTNARIFNPLSTGGPLPFLGGIQTRTFDPITGEQNPYSQRAPIEDKLKRMYEGTYTKVHIRSSIPPIDVEALQTRNSKGETLGRFFNRVNIANERNKFTETLPFADTRGTGEQEAFTFGGDVNQAETAGIAITKPDLSKLFRKQNIGVSYKGADKGGAFYQPDPAFRVSPSPSYLRQKGALQNEDVWFSFNDYETGYIVDGIDDGLIDDDFYIPFSFQDLRKPDRRIYFRAWLDSVNESISPNWTKDSFYGRVDPVGTYMNTERSFDVSFKIIAMSTEGLSSMYKKIMNFVKMLYPTYRNGIMVSAPLIRIKLGDLFATSAGLGLPGFIQSANFDWNSFPWETRAFSEVNPPTAKVPMGCKLSFKFQVIHEANPSVDEDYNFTSGIFRRFPATQEDTLENSQEEFDVDEELTRI